MLPAYFPLAGARDPLVDDAAMLIDVGDGVVNVNVGISQLRLGSRAHSTLRRGHSYQVDIEKIDI